MYIDSINKYSAMNVKENTFKSKKMAKNVSKKLIKLTPQEEKDKLKILLASAADIFSLNPKFRVPKTLEEKVTALEILKHRLNLDILVKLSHERFNLGKMIDEYNLLVDTDPKSEKCQELGKEIRKKGNLKNYYKMNHRLIEDEKKRQKSSLDYFTEIFGGIKLKEGSSKDAIKLLEQGKAIDEVYTQVNGLEEDFIEQGKIKEEDFDNFERYVRKNNINKEGNYNIRNLIDIIENTEIKGETLKTSNVDKEEKVVQKPFSKKEILNIAEKLYEDYLKEAINVFDVEKRHDLKLGLGRKLVSENKYVQNQLKHNDSFKKELMNVCESVDKRFIEHIEDLDLIRPADVSPFWYMAKEMEDSMRECIKDINRLKMNKNNLKSEKELKIKEDLLQELKQNWICYMLEAVVREYAAYKAMDGIHIVIGDKKDKKNNIKENKIYTNEYVENKNTVLKVNSMNDFKDYKLKENEEVKRIANPVRCYRYLTERHKDLNKYNSLFEIYYKNGNSIPEDIWEKILNAEVNLDNFKMSRNYYSSFPEKDFLQ